MDDVPLKPAMHEERKRHIWRERNLKEIAALIFIASAFGVVSQFIGLPRLIANPPEAIVASFLATLLWLAINAFFCWTSRQLWLLRPSGRWALWAWVASLLFAGTRALAIDLSGQLQDEAVSDMAETIQKIVAGSMLLLAAGLILLCWAKKTRRVLSPQYAQVIEQTPQISNRITVTAMAVLFAIGLFLVFQLMNEIFLLITTIGL